MIDLFATSLIAISNLPGMAGLMLAQGAAGGGSAQKPSDMAPIMFMIMAIGAVAYFTLLRPQKKEQKEREELLNQVKKGDQVVTIGGLHGKVLAVDLNTNIVTLELAPKMPAIRVNKSAVASVKTKDSEKDQSKSMGGGGKKK